MSARYVPVGWGRTKIVHDLVLLAAVTLYLLIYQRLGAALMPFPPPDEPTMAMKAYGTCAFLLVSAILCIGPLARLDPRLLPILYTRRHFGVIACAVATGHVAAVLDWYFAYSPVPPIEAMLGADLGSGGWHGFPFIPFGVAAFLILCLLAATSHDFWLAFLTPPVWKAIHMSLYAGYALAVAHVALGALQSATNPTLAIVVTLCASGVSALHVMAGLRSRSTRVPLTEWIDAGPAAAIADGCAIVVHPARGEAIAVFRDGEAFAAISNVCAHQNGPLGEGRIVDGCVTCPWHGFQYRLADGRAPAPFTERVAVYAVRQIAGRILVDPRPLNERAEVPA